MKKRRDTLLRGALHGNLLFTVASIVVLIGFADPLAGAMGLPSPMPLTIVGLGLIPFATFVAWNARRRPIHVPSAILTSVGAFGWVIGSGVLLVGWSDPLDTCFCQRGVAGGAPTRWITNHDAVRADTHGRHNR